MRVKIIGNCNSHGFNPGEIVILKCKMRGFSPGQGYAWVCSGTNNRAWYVRECDMAPTKTVII